LDFKKKYGIDLLRPDTISDYIKKLKSSEEEYNRFSIVRMGYRENIFKNIPLEKFNLLKRFKEAYGYLEHL
jgi:hypothetical protein